MTKNDITRKGKNLAFLLRHDKEAFGDGRIDRHGKPFVIKIDSIMSKAHWPQGRNLRSLMSFANNDVNVDRKKRSHNGSACFVDYIH